MTVAATKVMAADTATLLAGSDPSGQSVAVKNLGAAVVFVGGPDVSTTDGWPLDPKESVTMELTASEKLYAIVAAGTNEVRVLRTGVAS